MVEINKLKNKILISKSDIENLSNSYQTFNQHYINTFDNSKATTLTNKTQTNCNL